MQPKLRILPAPSVGSNDTEGHGGATNATLDLPHLPAKSCVRYDSC